MKEDEMSKLKPCPFCGKDEAYLMTDKWGNYYVECEYCGAQINPYDDKEIIVEGWQSRPIEDDLRKRIAELEEKQRWIPVSERLPEFGTSILFYDSILERTNKGTCTALNRDKTNLQWLTDDGIYYHGNRCEYITHWKEEPARPEAQQ